MLLPASISFILGVCAICAAVVGARRLALLLAGPALFRWVFWPVLVRLFAGISVGSKLMVAASVVIFIPFLLIGLVQKLTSLAYGERASGHVTATYLVRVLDGFGAALLAVVTWPFRFTGRMRDRP